MLAQIAKVGNSQGIRINKELLITLGLKIGDMVELYKKDNTDEIVLKPIKGIKWYLEDYERPDADDENESWESYNEPKGREVW